jgi:hypothetical protein
MKKIALIIVALSFCSSTSAQDAAGIIDPIDNPFMPPPVVPGYQACMSMFGDYVDCMPNFENHGQSQCVAINREYFETLNCPSVFSWQAEVNANAFAGNSPRPTYASAIANRLRMMNRLR